MAADPPLLSAEERRRLDRFSYRLRHRLDGMWAGAHRSDRTGDSLDFADYRPYNPGDDVRRIDHNLWARLGVVLIKLYEGEDEAPLDLVIDRSASMSLPRKWHSTLTAAAVVSYLALAGGDRVRLTASPGDAGRPFKQGPAMRQKSSWPAVEDWLTNLRPEGLAPLPDALIAVAPRSRGPVVLISDLMDPAWPTVVSRVGLGRGGTVIQVLDPAEIDPDIGGDLNLVDIETGVNVDMSVDQATIGPYQTRLESMTAEVARTARRRGLDNLLLVAGDDTVSRIIDDAFRGAIIQ